MTSVRRYRTVIDQIGIAAFTWKVLELGTDRSQLIATSQGEGDYGCFASAKAAFEDAQKVIGSVPQT